MKYEAVLFDLDGTLIESAPDLIKTLNDMLIKYGRETISYDLLRPHVSYGSTKLLEIGFNKKYPVNDAAASSNADKKSNEDIFQTLRNEYLALYKTQNTDLTHFFPDIEILLDSIESNNIPWAVVTNKPTDCTTEIVDELNITKRAGAIICGDTLPVAKPHPEPILLACEIMNVNPKNCIYIGDCIRDIQAGHNAGMKTIACEFGYIGDENDIHISEWNADFIAKQPGDIIKFL